MVFAEWPAPFVTALEEAWASFLLRLLEDVVALLSHGLEVVRIPEQLGVFAVRLLMVHDVSGYLLPFVMWALAVRMLGKL